ncbi:uncharacterized protein BJ212DRAFT_1582920 [Suillus subaureus]|uniref:Uncharacterized protein n=1 Tax=Suillus subaureus TaxID=48587 RepID=A0A9P7DI28_9AGAM|nr:uncharacterized protein BJ212DRAFT_1582920 [Suillus subaureus]KAG1793760.1 hypothetical protein BJ212DRAFT_1582920 [Suillus subaureus]
MPPPPEARTVDMDTDSEDEFDDGTDWLDGPAALSQFKAVEKYSFVLAASSGIYLRAPYLRELPTRLDPLGAAPVTRMNTTRDTGQSWRSDTEYKRKVTVEVDSSSTLQGKGSGIEHDD